MNPSKNITYVPGVCNIGPEEIARRRMIGWIFLVVTVALFVILFAAHANPWWRLFVFLPATASAAGFIQAHYKFCFGFASKGVFNLGVLGAVQTVTDLASGAKDRKAAAKILAYSVAIGAIVALIAALM